MRERRPEILEGQESRRNPQQGARQVIPTIGLMVAAYVSLRCVDIILSMSRGGTREGLNTLASAVLMLLAAVALVVAIVGGLDLLQSGTDLNALRR